MASTTVFGTSELANALSSISISDHAIKRMHQRDISEDEIREALLTADNDEEKRITIWGNTQKVTHNGLCVVVNLENYVITAYRSSRSRNGSFLDLWIDLAAAAYAASTSLTEDLRYEACKFFIEALDSPSISPKMLNWCSKRFLAGIDNESNISVQATLITQCALLGLPKLVAALLEKGADPNCPNYKYRELSTLDCMFYRKGCDEGKLESARLIMEHLRLYDNSFLNKLGPDGMYSYQRLCADDDVSIQALELFKKFGADPSLTGPGKDRLVRFENPEQLQPAFFEGPAIYFPEQTCDARAYLVGRAHLIVHPRPLDHIDGAREAEGWWSSEDVRCEEEDFINEFSSASICIRFLSRDDQIILSLMSEQTPVSSKTDWGYPMGGVAFSLSSKRGKETVFSCFVISSAGEFQETLASETLPKKFDPRSECNLHIGNLGNGVFKCKLSSAQDSSIDHTIEVSLSEHANRLPGKHIVLCNREKGRCSEVSNFRVNDVPVSFNGASWSSSNSLGTVAYSAQSNLKVMVMKPHPDGAPVTYAGPAPNRGRGGRRSTSTGLNREGCDLRYRRQQQGLSQPRRADGMWR